MGGGTTIAVSLQKDGLIAGLSLTKRGQLRVNAYNTPHDVVHIAPKIAMVIVRGNQLEVKYLGQGPKVIKIYKERVLGFGEKLREEITKKYPKVDNFSLHSINDKLVKLGTQCTEVK